MGLKRLSDNRLRHLVVILSEAKNLINLDTCAFEILRLTPQNDIVGEPLKDFLALIICMDR